MYIPEPEPCYTEDGWYEDGDYDLGSSSAFYSETFDQEIEPKERIGF